ncbi:MAG TPA: carboxypeptidase regulatory-like domain-containing protein [Kofleriaceae bacterium]
MNKLAAATLVVGAGFAVVAHAAPSPGEIRGTVTVKGRKTSAGVLVYLEGVPGPAPAPTDHAVVRQREKQFDPPVTVVVRGTTVDFPNEDKIFHNVFSVSRPARFDLGLYKSGTTKSVEMKRAGTVDVYCNIHSEMVAKVKVLDNAYYTTTDAQGRFRIAGVPAGTIPVVAWLPTGDQATATVTVRNGEVVDVKLEVTAVAKRETHTRKDGSPYGRYK